MTTKFKPGQVYCCRSSGDSESTLYLILEVKSIGTLTHVKFIKFENVGESAAPTLTVRTCPTTHLSLGYTRIVKEQTKRELVLNLCTANCINTDKIQALWTQLDENKFEVGEVYTNAYYEALTHYLCVEINANNQPLFLDYNQIHQEPFLAHEDILKRLQLIKDKDHRSTMLSNFEAAINQVISDCEKNRSKVRACYFN